MCSYYSDDQLARWEDVMNPMGAACHHCTEECIHNPNWDWENDCMEEFYDYDEEDEHE